MADDKTWKLVWSDEFDYAGLPDKTKWSYEEGLLRNKEQQYYTRERKENVRVEDGMLVIEGRKEPFPIANKDGTPSGKNADYTAASLVTFNKASWLYGRIEVRAKLPQGKGVWPAIWTLGANKSTVGWPACGECDIMEFWGKQPGVVQATVHYGMDGRHKKSGAGTKVPRLDSDFHIYAMEWFPTRIDFFCDGKKYKTFTIDEAGAGEENAFRKPHFLLINLALGGPIGGKIDDAMLPAKYLIDYVRVYERKSTAPN